MFGINLVDRRKTLPMASEVGNSLVDQVVDASDSGLDLVS